MREKDDSAIEDNGLEDSAGFWPYHCKIQNCKFFTGSLRKLAAHMSNVHPDSDDPSDFEDDYEDKEVRNVPERNCKKVETTLLHIKMHLSTTWSH